MDEPNPGRRERRALLLLGLAGCALPSHAAPPQDAPGVTVFAAASLADVLHTLADRWHARAPTLRFSLAASSTLARQIEQGANADIFVSADEDWMDYLERRGRIEPGSRRDLASNALVVVRRGPAAGAAAGESIETLRRALLDRSDAAGHVVTGDPAHVPVGRYAKQALVALGLWAAVEPRLVRADNVRSALAFVERGEANAGIVYATDARVGRGLFVAARFPASSHAPIRYPAALVKGAGRAAREVLERLFSREAQTVLREAGFGPATKP
jgi:molybdate transport system substrate-binding protein